MMTPFTVASYMNNWMLIGAKNVIVSLADVALYYYYAHNESTSLGKLSRNYIEVNMILSIAILVVGINSTTTFHYCYEKWYRKLYFTEKRLERSKLKWKAVLNCLPVGILIVNHRSEIKHTNKEIRGYIPASRNLSASILGEATQEDLTTTPCDSDGLKLTLEEMKSIKDRSN
ncbi:MAG: hypothetical protein P4M11_07865, partial [Candidatus Pacebacteria bacterium]|nr:hypothetical protein [Candidatus Paceibacterota bacterium]